MKKIRIFIGLMFICLLGYCRPLGLDAKEIVQDRDPLEQRAMGYIDEGFYGIQDNEELPSEEMVSVYAKARSESDIMLLSDTPSDDVRWGIDVSKYQGNIDWNKVKQAGVSFVFVRVGYRGTDAGTLQEDPYFRTNIQGALDAGLKVGVYMFSQAITTSEAVEEAEYIVNRISSYKINLPVVIDYEYVGGGRLEKANLNNAQRTAIVNAFCQRVENSGYTGMVYANWSMLTYDLNASDIDNQYKVWLARYNSYAGYSGEYDFWQYSSKGTVDGISGYVDLNYWYVKNGVDDFSLNGLQYKEGSGWHYYKNGEIDYSYVGLADNSYGKWFIRDGEIDSSFSGMWEDLEGWWYVDNGMVDFYYTGLASNSYGTWRFVNGRIDYGFTGPACYDNVWYYFTGGKWDATYAGMVQISGEWKYFQDGKLLNDFTGMACKEDGWWYFENGKLQTTYTGLANNAGNTWCFLNGRINYNYTGMLYNHDVWYYVRGGQIIYDYTGMAYGESGWKYFQDGKLLNDFTGMACKEDGWWYFEDGTINYEFTGTYDHYGTQFTIIEGKGM